MLPIVWFTHRFACALEQLVGERGSSFQSQMFAGAEELLTELRLNRAQPDIILIEFSEGLQSGLNKSLRAPERVIWLLDPVLDVDEGRAFESMIERFEMDFVTWPIDSLELRIRIAKILSQKERLLTSFADFLDKLDVDLSGKELRILRLFSTARDQSLSRDELMQAFWHKKPVHPKALDVQIFNLRKKLEKVDMEIRFRPEARVWQFISKKTGIASPGGESMQLKATRA